jgi:hypothetical protein
MEEHGICPLKVESGADAADRAAAIACFNKITYHFVPLNALMLTG